MAHWRCTEAFDLSSSPSLYLSRLTSSFSVSSFNSSFPSNSSGSLFLHHTVPHLVPSARLYYSPCVADYKSVHRCAHTEIRATPPSTLSTLCVCSSGFDRARHRSLHPLGISRCFPFSLLPFSPCVPSPPLAVTPATLQSATTCIHPATKPPRLLGSTINETVH